MSIQLLGISSIMHVAMKIIALAGICICLIPNQSRCQPKFEREYRVNTSEVPASALKYVNSCQFNRKVKWFVEEQIGKTSFEAKVKRGGRLYSIEFDSIGTIEDVEIEIEWDLLEPSEQDSICTVLDRTFRKYKVIRIQLHLPTPDAQEIASLRKTFLPAGNNDLKYELIVEGITNGERHWYELLVTRLGVIERQSVIVFRNTDNLDY